LFLTARNPFRFVEREDTIEHTISEGDTLYTLAGRYYNVIDPERACGLWWVIADFQPTPVHDPTCLLEVGRIVYVPSPTVVTNEVFSEARRTTA
jgi:hypothetical protein